MTRLAALPRRWAAPVAAALLTIAVTGAALGTLMRLDRARWDVPFEYEGDSLLMQALVQTGLEQPWYLATPRLGAPRGQAMYDYPCADTLDIVLVKMVGFFERRPAAVFNALYLLTYPLAALAMLAAARRLGLGWPAAVAAAVLFAFLPYHALRGQRHLFLTTYFPIPLMVVVLAEIAMGRLPFFPEGDDGRTRFRLTDGRTLWAVAAAVLLGAANPYYAYFALLLLPAAGAIDVLGRRRVRGLLSAALVGILLAGSVVANTLPTLIFRVRHGPNPTAHFRPAEEAEHYGLKFNHLLLPVENHPSAWVRSRRAIYRPESRPMENENTHAALGVVGAIGFLGLLAVLLVPRPDRPPRVTALAQLNLVAFLIGTLGGVGVLINIYFSQFRCYNRISILIGCFALLAVGGWIDAALARWRGRWSAPRLLVVVGLVAFGVWDGATLRIRPDYADLADRWDADAALVRVVEERLPPQCRVFQLPVVRFPESPVVNDLAHYQSLVGYLHSTRLEWSYGAVRGRPGAEWQADLGPRLEKAETLNAALEELKRARFGAVWVDWQGYAAEERDALRQRVTRRLGGPIAARPGGGTECYRLGGE